MRTSSNIKAGKNRMFKKYLNAGHPRNFIFSVINAFDIKVGKYRIYKKYLNTS